MRRRPTAYVVGYYGMLNFGDDLFCDVVRTHADRLLPGYDVKIVGDYSKRNRGGGFVNSLSSRWFSSLSSLGSAVRLTAGLKALVCADLIVLGGGSVLSRVQGVWAVQMRLAALFRTSFRALGVSIGPFSGGADREAISRFAQRFESMIVRDASSLKSGLTVAPNSNVTLGGDLAALYSPTGIPMPREAQTRRVGIALCNFTGFGESEVLQLASATIEALESTKQPNTTDHIFVVSLNSNNDYGDDELSRIATAEFARRAVCVSYVRYADLSVSEVWSLLASMDGLVAVRLHAAISAYLTSVPFVLLEYHQKCIDFCDDIGQDLALRLSGIPTRSDSVDSIATLFSSPSPTTLAPSAYAARARSVYFGAEQ